MPVQIVVIKIVCPTCGGDGDVQWGNPPEPPMQCPSCGGSGKVTFGGFKLKITEDGRLAADE